MNLCVYSENYIISIYLGLIEKILLEINNTLNFE